VKRLNPKTGKQFKRGDVRQDGFIFKSYKLTKLDIEGFFKEDWRSPKAFENVKKIGYALSAKKALTPKGRAHTLLYNSISRAKQSNIEHTITVNDILPAIENGFCELTNLPFDLGPPVNKATQHPYAPSVDRINSLKGYTKDNVRIVLYSVNAALGQFGTNIMTPILKAMVKAIDKNAQKNTTTPVPTGNYSEGNFDTKYGALFTAGLGQDHYNAYHNSGAIPGQDTDHRAQESSGDSVGHGGKEMATSEPFTRIENNGEPDTEIVRLDFASRHLSD